MSYSYGKSIVTDGLVFYVDAANENSYPGSGTDWADLSGDATATLTNGPTYSSNNGGYIDFDGSNDHVEVTGINVSALSAFTLEAWVYPASSSADETVMGKWLGSLANSSFLLYWDVGDSALGFDWIVVNTSNTYSRIGTSTANGTVNAWNHVVATFSGSQIELYVNGSSVGTASFSGTLRNISGVRLGADESSGLRPLAGNLAVAKVYDKVLSSDEITQNYNALKNRFV
jgi:hypothetical protein